VWPAQVSAGYDINLWPTDVSDTSEGIAVEIRFLHRLRIDEHDFPDAGQDEGGADGGTEPANADH
jgi:hypothetical protein